MYIQGILSILGILNQHIRVIREVFGSNSRWGALKGEYESSLIKSPNFSWGLNQLAKTVGLGY